MLGTDLKGTVVETRIPVRRLLATKSVKSDQSGHRSGEVTGFLGISGRLSQGLPGDREWGCEDSQESL